MVEEGGSLSAGEELADLDERSKQIVALVDRIASGDFAARGSLEGKPHDAVMVALHTLAECFEREHEARARAEALLADALDSYDHAPDSFCSCEVGTLRIRKCNDTMSEVLGVPIASVLGRSILDFVQPSSRANLEHTLDTLAETGKPCETEIELARPAGPLVASLTASVTFDANGAPERLLLVLRDVTATRRLQSHLAHAQRMEALGRLAGGVAHDFNNLLFVMLELSQTLAQQLQGSPAQPEHVIAIQQAAERCATLTKDLLAFARNESVAPAKPLVVDVEIAKARGILSRLVKGAVTLELELEAPDAKAVIDGGQLGQVLVNLVVNARDAMPDGGRVTIRTGVSTYDEHSASQAGIAGGTYVEIRVVDTGSGIPADVQAQIFEPFFTTKPAGRGTGLGLSMVYGAVRRANGHVTVHSEMGGTTFTVLLPVANERASESPRTAPKRDAPTILLVEDDDLVRAVTKRILGGAGYAILEAASGAEAVEHLRAQPEAVSLIVSDIMMPGLNGFETLAKLREIRDDLACLFVTGFSHEEGNARAFERVRVLEKPFVPSTLLANVRALLDA